MADLFQKGSSNMKGSIHIETPKQRENNIRLLTTLNNQEKLYNRRNIYINNYAKYIKLSTISLLPVVHLYYNYIPMGHLLLLPMVHL